jgi:heme exporter protein CcmD
VSYVVAGYVVTFVSLGTYAGWVVRRRRALARVLPAEPRR